MCAFVTVYRKKTHITVCMINPTHSRRCLNRFVSAFIVSVALHIHADAWIVLSVYFIVCVGSCSFVFFVQTSAAYLLFYHRRTEGMPSKSRKLDRSLSESFAEEVRNGPSASKASTDLSRGDSIQEDMEEEEEEEKEEDTRENKKKKEDSMDDDDRKQF